MKTRNKLDRDLNLFRKTWETVLLIAGRDLKNSDDNKFYVETTFGGVTKKWRVLLKVNKNMYVYPIKVLRTPAKKFWKITVKEESWAVPADSYDEVGGSFYDYHTEVPYMTWEEMAAFIANREEVLKQLREQIAVRNKAEEETPTPFELLFKQHGADLEKAIQWLSET